jgi:uncharacterized protein YjiS (DUF1127 family)
MRTTLGAPVTPQSITEKSLAKVIRAKLRGYWAAYINWRIEQAAIDQLKSLSDRELKDIGLDRSGIIGAVRNKAERRRYY